MAKNRRKVGAGRSDSKKLDELVDELAQVAKESVPLDQGSFIRRKAILHCDAVQALAPGADDGTLASQAEVAILGAIESISANIERQIARAMFAVEDEYRDTPIYERQELLLANENISRHVWNARRTQVLDAVAAALLAPVAGVVGPRPSGTQPTVMPLRGIALQAQRAAILHYAALTTLFVSEFDREAGSVNALRTPSQAYFFNAYIALMYGPWFELVARPNGKLALRQGYVEELDSEVLARIAHLGQVLDSGSPIGPTTQTASRAAHALHFHAQLEAALATNNYHLISFNDLLPSVDAYDWPDQTEAKQLLSSSLANLDRPRLMDVYAAWCRWLAHDMAGESRGQAVEQLAGASGALSTLLGARVKRGAIHTVARSLAQKALGTYYDFPAWEPLADGYSLKQQADAFFDRVGPSLLGPYLR